MRLLLYEYLSAGGLPDAPRSLLREGWAMLAAFAADARRIPWLHPFTLVGPDLPCLVIPFRAITTATEEAAFRAALQECDAALVIAPEFDGLLAERCRWVLGGGKQLLGLAPAAVDQTADKLACARWLQEKAIPTLPTEVYSEERMPGCFPAVVKPRDGAGCLATFLVASAEEWGRAAERVRAEAGGKSLIVQPHHAGLDASAVFMVGGGRVVPLRAGAQDIVREHGRLEYAGGALPLPADLEERALRLGERVVRGLVEEFSSSSGFVGVDLLLGSAGDGSEDIVVEVNPRPTTSYVGLRRLTEDNLLLKVLELGEGRPVEPPRWRSGRLRFSPGGEVAP